jgi:ribosomal protein S18 acetylase RimI-like enzyme
MTRRSQTSDAEAIGQLLHDFNTEYDEFTPGPEALGKRLRWLLARGEVTVVLAGNPPCGLALMRFRPALSTDTIDCYLEELYVVPDRRGQGTGEALLRAAIEVAREEGATYIDLGTAEDDVAARGLYEKLGFDNTGGKPDGPVNYFYERELS